MKEENRSEIIQDALNFLDDEMIEEVQKLRGGFLELDAEVEDSQEIKLNATESKKMHFPWRKWTVLAASVCLFVVGSWIFGNVIAPMDTSDTNYSQTQGDASNVGQEESTTSLESEESTDKKEPIGADGVSSNEAYEESLNEEDILDGSVVQDLLYGTTGSGNVGGVGVTFPKADVSLKKESGIEEDMLAFFIHDGRCYVQYDRVERGATFVGNYVTSITGFIDEWTPEDGYVDGAGTFTGKVYEVKGIRPEFMLCTIWSDGSVEVFINNNGITLYKGADLVDDRLNLRNNFVSVSFQSDYDRANSLENPTILNEEHYELFGEMLDAFSEGNFVYVEGKSNYLFGGDLNNEDVYHVYYTTNNGVRLWFALLGDGYISFPWLDKGCIQIDQELYNQIVEVLQNN